MSQTYFVVGISTEVGKTIASAIIVETLKADYWKPIQAGELENSDTQKVRSLVSNKASKFHKCSYQLVSAMSPHAAAKIDGIAISVKNIVRPKTKNNLVIEGSGGLLVPLNDKETMLDIIKSSDKVILVSRQYLGSINHTLLTIELLKQRNLNVFGIIFSGNENKSSEEIIKKMANIKILGRIEEEPYFDKNVILEYAEIFKKSF